MCEGKTNWGELVAVCNPQLAAAGFHGRIEKYAIRFGWGLT